MGQYIFKLPDIGEGTAEAELVAWHVAVGDRVAEDQPLADVMTDKATVELTSPVAGTVTILHGTIGEMAPVGASLVELDISGGDGAAIPPADAEPAPAAAAEQRQDVQPSATVPAASPDAPRPKASPAVRKRAKELGIALEKVRGSGPHGRIRQSDLEAYLAYAAVGPSAAPVAVAPLSPLADSEFQDVRLSGLRRKIAEKMELSSRHIPHFAYIEEVDVTELEQVRARLNQRYQDERPKLSFLPFLIRALCALLPRYPQINGHYDEASGVARRYGPVHMGIAAQTDGGLMVPVLRNAERLGLWDLAAGIRRLSEDARSGAIKRDEVTGSTITVTSLGTLGGLATTPIINHPEVAIIGPNRIVERPLARGGAVVLRRIMNISSSFDHRVVDGDDAARFVQDLRVMLEDPALLLAA